MSTPEQHAGHRHPIANEADGPRGRADGIRLAGTAVVLRDGRDGLETLLLRRPSTGSFADAWVFPGGRVDPGDRRGVGAESEAARRAAVRETQEEAGIRVHSLQPLSLWVPPAETPVRYRTWFFLAREQGEPVQPNAGEIAEAAWMTPQHAFAAHAAGAFTLVPPTWVTLHGLLDRRTVDEAFAAVDGISRYETRMLSTPSGRRVMWAGDEDYPDAGAVAGARHRLIMDALPWVYERS